jgi:hypothetical protein
MFRSKAQKEAKTKNGAKLKHIFPDLQNQKKKKLKRKVAIIATSSKKFIQVLNHGNFNKIKWLISQCYAKRD